MTTTSAKQSDTMQDMLCSLSGNWWLFVLRGVLALVIAVLAFLMPAESLLALTLVFGASPSPMACSASSPPSATSAGAIAGAG